MARSFEFDEETPLTTQAERYPESRLQSEAVPWLCANWGYVEIFEDKATHKGSAFDSIGSMGGRLVLIEVKPRIDRNMAWHESSKNGSLERKVLVGLKNLFQGSNDVASVAARRIWDGRSRPIIAILAGGFSAAGREEAEAMLRARGDRYCFDWRLLRWTGSVIEEIAACDAAAEPGVAYASIEFPTLQSSRRRKPAPPLESWLKRAESDGNHLLKHFLLVAQKHGFRLISQAGSLRLERRVPGGRWVSFLSVFPSIENGVIGVNVSVRREDVGLEEHEMPGRSTTSIKGFFNTNRFLCEAAEMDAMLSLFVGPARES